MSRKSEEQEKEEMRESKGTITGGFILFCILIFIGILLLRTYVVTSFIVEGASMEPTLSADKIVWVYKRVSITRGDVIVAHSQELDKKLVKRMVALPGDSILLVQNGEDEKGKPLYDLQITTAEGETYLERYGEFTPPSLTQSHLGCLSADEPYLVTGYFIMGDNRNNSSDSRTFGEFSREQSEEFSAGYIVGKVVNA